MPKRRSCGIDAMTIDPFLRSLDDMLHDLPPQRRQDIMAAIVPLRRYALLMEQAVLVSQAAFAGDGVEKVAHLLLSGARRVGSYPAGAFGVVTPAGPVIAAAFGDFAGTEGRRAPVELVPRQVTRLAPEQLHAVSAVVGITPPVHELYLVPVASPTMQVGALALLDADGESADDRLMESYASRAAMAYLHAAHQPR
jgi:hypothetical protein